MSAKLLEGPTMYNNRDAMMMPFHDGARDFFFPSLFSRLLVFLICDITTPCRAKCASPRLSFGSFPVCTNWARRDDMHRAYRVEGKVKELGHRRLLYT